MMKNFEIIARVSTLLLICFVVTLVRNEKYILLRFSQSDLCDGPYLGDFFYGIDTGNSIEFGDNAKLQYDEEMNTINITTYTEYTCYEQSETIQLGVGNCVQLENYFVNITVVNSLTFSENLITSEWAVQSRFVDDQCSSTSRLPFVKYGVRIFNGPNNILSSGIMNQTTRGFCTSTFFVLSPNSREYQVYWRSTMEGTCLQEVDDPTVFQKLECISHEDVMARFNDRLLTISSRSYYRLRESFSENCSEPFYRVEVHPLGVCKDGYIEHASEDVITRTYYDSTDCSDRNKVSGYYITQSPSDPDIHLMGVCNFVRVDEEYPAIKNYQSMLLSDDPYFPRKFALLVSTVYTCDDDITPLKKNPALAEGLSYFDRDWCENLVSGSEVDNIATGGFGRSIKGGCDNDGRLFIKSYSDSGICMGYFEEKEVSVSTPASSSCFERIDLPGVYVHALCLERYCSDISSLDAGVCSGRGKCVGSSSNGGMPPYCDCDDGYSGLECEVWSCYGFDSHETQIVCSGSGTCKEANKCVCKSGWSGEKCQNADIKQATKVFIYTGTSVFIVSACVACCCCLFYCCCVFWCCVVSVYVVFCVLCGGGVVVANQKKKISKYDQLEDFDLLLREQLMEKDHTQAHLKIDKTLFEIDFDEVKVSKMIGEGGSEATVYLATWRGNKVAFKCFKTRRIMSDQDNFNEFEAEVNLLAHVNHPNIIRFYGASLKPPRVGIVMEFCENGELLDFLQKYRKENDGVGYEMREKLRMCREIISAIEYLHSRNIIHRDVKSENVLIDSSERCKLMDFGISRIISDQEGEYMKTRGVGTSVYMAPEILTGTYDEKVDSFSFSILLWVIFCEKGDPYEQILVKHSVETKIASDPNLRPKMDDLELSFMMEGRYDWIKEVIRKCWSHDPHKRYNFSQLSKFFEMQEVDEKKYEIEGGGKQSKKRSEEDDEKEKVIRKVMGMMEQNGMFVRQKISEMEEEFRKLGGN